jgi:hypothetical protein
MWVESDDVDVRAPYFGISSLENAMDCNAAALLSY